MNRYNFKYITRSVIIAVLFFTATQQVSAQLTGLQSMYFENQYLANPAFAGLNKGVTLNLGYQQQWNSVPGAPKIGDFSAEFGSGNKVGLGLLVNSDQSGLINVTRIVATYAYHLPLNENDKLSFGISAGVNDSYINYYNISGDQADASVALFNQRRTYFDGDFGVAYTGKGLRLQAAVPNLGATLFKTNGTNLDVDRAVFFAAASYQLPLSSQDNSFTLEPKVVYRAIKGYTGIVDGGFNLMMNEYHFNISALYHSNQSVTGGIGFDLHPVRLLFSYTNNTGPLHSDANNTFEFGIRYSFLTN